MKKPNRCLGVALLCEMELDPGISLVFLLSQTENSDLFQYISHGGHADWKLFHVGSNDGQSVRPILAVMG
jgi:hypothetical protein